MFSSRLGCSSVSFRHQPLLEALRTIREIGFQEIDPAAPPGVCEHVPCVLDGAAVDQVAAEHIPSLLSELSTHHHLSTQGAP